MGDEVDRASESALYGFVLRHLLARAPLDLIEVKRLLIDERDKASRVTQGMRIAASPVLLARGLKQTPRFRGEPAHQSDGLQVADMLAGAVMNKVRGGTDYLRGSRLRLTIYHYT